jgi:hypothetical protein
MAKLLRIVRIDKANKSVSGAKYGGEVKTGLKGQDKKITGWIELLPVIYTS